MKIRIVRPRPTVASQRFVKTTVRREDTQVPRAGQQPVRENTGQNEGANPTHPKIHPTDDETAELLTLWATLNDDARAGVLALAHEFSQNARSL